MKASVGTQTALLRQISTQAGNCPTREQMEALARDVAQMRGKLIQTGKKRDFHCSAQPGESAAGADLAGSAPA